MTQKQKTKIVIWIISVIGIIGIIFLATFITDTLYKNKFYPGIKVAGVSLGGLDKAQAKKIFEAKILELNSNGQKFFYQNKYFNLYPITFSTSDPDLIYEIISFDLNSTLNKVYTLGRADNFWESIWQKVKLIFSKKSIKIDGEIKSDEIEKILKESFGYLEKPGQNPQIKFINDEIKIEKEKIGLIFDYTKLMQQLKQNLAALNFEPIELELNIETPKFIQAQVEPLINEIQEVDNLWPIKIKATSTYDYPLEWNIEKEKFRDWLDFDYNKISKQVNLVFNPDKIDEFLETLKTDVERQIQEAKFKLENNRVLEFQAAHDGREIDNLKTLQNFAKDILQDKKSVSQIMMDYIKPNTSTGSVNDLGISELIGVGTSNYSGSPRNRRHNIKVGADSLNGLLLKPGEEFSLNVALGNITAAKGYLPELVIKGNETVPEYGGGLCQIATTMFRLAIDAGLEITARKPHAYRVSYYEPAGTDATIYSPWPDLRFINDTDQYLLLQTKVFENDLRFEFWGTADGREVVVTKPQVYNILAPGPTKYIETTQLPPEKVSCTEIAHAGADAHFYRTITYPDGEKKEEIWESHYRPWQAVCLIGVDPSKMATSTSEIISE